MRLGMIGGVKSNGSYWQSLDGQGLAHSPDYVDYSQLYREFTFDRQAGYVVVGRRNGVTVYAAPDYLKWDNGVYRMVSANIYLALAAERDAFAPTRSEIKALYDQCSHIPMPTQPIWETGGPGSSELYTDQINAKLKGLNLGPVCHGKEFYQVD